MISELQLLRGTPIDIGCCKIHPLTTGEIESLGESNFNKYLSVLMISKSDTRKEDINPEFWGEFLKMDEFEYLLLLIYQNQEIQETILSSLSLFLKEQINFNSQYGLFIQREDGIIQISKEIFNQIKEVVAHQNFINKGSSKEEEFNPYDDKARELIEKRNRYKKLIQEQNAEEGLNLTDIISVVACHSPNINFFNVWNLTVYHLYTIYLRMAMKDEYETYIHLLPHSSENNSKNIKHWMSKLNKNN
jgi:hypothetical protein